MRAREIEIERESGRERLGDRHTDREFMCIFNY